MMTSFWSSYTTIIGYKLKLKRFAIVGHNLRGEMINTVLVDLLKWILYHLYQERYSDCKSKPTLTGDYNAAILDLLY